MEQNTELISRTIRRLVSEIPLYGYTGNPIDIILCYSYLVLDERHDLVAPSKELHSYCEALLYSIHMRYNQGRLSYLFKELTSAEIRSMVWACILGADTMPYHLRDDYSGSGKPLSRLVYKLLKFEKDDIFYDFGSGLGTTLLTVYAESLQEGQIPVEHLYGSEINNNLATLSEIALRILIEPDHFLDCRIDHGDAFVADIPTYTKGYVYQTGSNTYLRDYRVSQLYPDIIFRHYNQTQWLYVDTLLAHLDKSKNSRAVAVLFSRSLSQVEHNDYVQRLISDGWIEGIIELPPILSGIGVNPYLVVFSQKNETVKMLVASSPRFISMESLRPRYRTAELNVEEIMSVYDNPDNDNCKVLTLDQLKGLNTLVPSRIPYFSLQGERAGYVPLESVADIMVGSQYTISSFVRSSAPTGYKVLTSSDIDNGMINWDKLASVEINKTLFDKYKVRKGDVIVTTKSSKVKTAVVDIDPKDNVIVTGGMIVVRPNPELLNPTYLKMYLDSDEGGDALKSVQTGTTIVSISLSDFRKIPVPKVDIVKQTIKATRYNDKLSSINAYRDQINKLEDELRYIISEDDE